MGITPADRLFSAPVMAMLALVACGGPRSEPPLVVLVQFVSSLPSDGDGVQLDFGLGGAAGRPAAAPGTLDVVLRERATRGSAEGSGDVVCSGHAIVPVEAFDESRGWRAQIGVRFDAPCTMPLPTGPERIRELTVTFTPDGRSALGNAYADAPGNLRWTQTRAEAAETMTNRELYSPRTTGADVERFRAYASSIAALAPLVATAPLGPCEALPEAVEATLIEYADLESIASRLSGGAVAPPARDRLTHSAVIGIGTLLSEHGSDASVVAAATWSGSAPDLVWVRRRTARTEGMIIDGSEFRPGSWSGTLHLARRSDARVLCGTEIRATSGPEVSATAPHGSESGALTQAIERDLDAQAESATYAAGERLAPDVRFERGPAADPL